MTDETLEISLVNDLRELARVAARIDEFCTARDLGPQVGYAVNLSIAQAGNARRHPTGRCRDAQGSGDVPSSFRVTVRSWMQ